MGTDAQAEARDGLHLSKCNCQSLTAASPVGAADLPLAMSETVDGAAPISAAISATVIDIGAARRSAMRDFQVGFAMTPSIRDPVGRLQRHTVTEFRHSAVMELPENYPVAPCHLGVRLRFWREFRKKSRAELGSLAGVAPTTLSSIENQAMNSSTRIAQLAEALQINVHYLATGEGHPLHMVQQVPPRNDWPEEFPPAQILHDLEPNERMLAGKELKEVIQGIKARRRRAPRREA